MLSRHVRISPGARTLVQEQAAPWALLPTMALTMIRTPLLRFKKLNFCHNTGTRVPKSGGARIRIQVFVFQCQRRTALDVPR